MRREFEDKVAIVTGGGSGIGEAIALELGCGGAEVIVADLDLDAAERVAGRVRDAGARAHAFAVDVADAAAVEKMVDFAVETDGGHHLAVNNAGIGGGGAATADYQLHSWRHVIDVNLRGVFYGM